MELAIGAIDKAALARITKKLNRFGTALINDDITIKTLELIQNYSLSHRLAIPDGIIAATAIVNDLELFTYNVKDYKFIPGLRLFKP